MQNNIFEKKKLQPHSFLNSFCQAILFLFFVAISNLSIAQNNRINNTTQIWTEVDFLGKISPKIKWQCDVQYSKQSDYEAFDFYNHPEQLTIRPWLHYYITPTIRMSTFFGLWYNYPIDAVGQREYPEYRWAAQLQFYKIWNRNKISNRFRPEIRAIKDRNGIFETVFRGRYMFKYMRLLNHDNYDKNSWYFIFQNEIFINGGSTTTGFKAFDQNRIFLGIGYNITDDIAFETGYFNQFQHHNHDVNFDNNNVWQVSLIFDNLTHPQSKK